MKKAVLDLGEAGCLGCARAIEKFGRRLPGVSEIRVDIGTHKIHVTYTGEDQPVLDPIIDVVHRIGHDAWVCSVEDRGDDCACREGKAGG